MSENSHKYHKNEIFYVHMSFLKETRVLHVTCLYNTHVYPKNVNICIETCIYPLNTRLMSLKPACSSCRCEKKEVSQSLGSLGGYATDSFSCN